MQKILIFKCIKCDYIFKGTSICKAYCSNCGYMHKCGEAEVIEKKEG